MSADAATKLFKMMTRTYFMFSPAMAFDAHRSLPYNVVGSTMLQAISDHLPEIRALCAKWGARRLELFGSAVRGEFDPERSDLDFFVEFYDLGWQGSFKRYMNLKLGLEDLFGVGVDLVEIDAVTNPYFLSAVGADRTCLYAA